MAATQAMNRGQGGWPMTVFMTPDGEPVGAEYPVTLCDLGIFADQATEPVPPQNPDIRVRNGRTLTPNRRALAKRPVRAMNVMVVGPFDNSTGQYLDNIVVYSHLIS